jgi:hypothetical protein
VDAFILPLKNKLLGRLWQKGTLNPPRDRWGAQGTKPRVKKNRQRAKFKVELSWSCSHLNLARGWRRCSARARSAGQWQRPSQVLRPPPPPRPRTPWAQLCSTRRPVPRPSPRPSPRPAAASPPSWPRLRSSSAAPFCASPRAPTEFHRTEAGRQRRGSGAAAQPSPAQPGRGQGEGKGQGRRVRGR